MRAMRVLAVAVAAACLLVVGALVWGAVRSADSSAVDDLPTVAEIVAAQAHRHGLVLPPLSDQDVASLSAPPTSVSSLSAYDQVLVQLQSVKAAGGLAEALAILSEVARESADVSADCPRLYDALVAGASGAAPVSAICGG